MNCYNLAKTIHSKYKSLKLLFLTTFNLKIIQERCFKLLYLIYDIWLAEDSIDTRAKED